MKPQYPSTEAESQYKQMLSLFTSFFKGNTKPIEKELLRQISLASDSQNFEWAGKLRDIYLQIEQFTEKQYVEIQKNLTGYVLEIRKI